MHRWQEEWEVKQAEFLRCIRNFQKMAIVWANLASSTTPTFTTPDTPAATPPPLTRKPGAVAYAQKKAAMYLEMERVARQKFVDAGYGDRLVDDGAHLVELIAKDRALHRVDFATILPIIEDHDDGGNSDMETSDQASSSSELSF